MATSTYKTFLMKGTSASSSVTYTKLLDIKDYPDLEPAPEMLQTTTLTDKSHTYIPGMSDSQGLPFTANYDEAKYAELKELEGVETMYALWMGGTESGGVVTPTGSEGKWEFKGYLHVGITGAGVNEVREMVVTIAPSSVVNFVSTT